MNETVDSAADRSCKTPRWRILKSQLNNYSPIDFKKEYTQAENPILLDVRQPHEYANFHLEDAIHINYFAEDFWDEIEKLDSNRPIFVYCRSGRRSMRVCTLMRNGGFSKENIYHLDGGLNTWEETFGTGQ
ncbi:MAG: rhodanese-like domain-containing protein [Saprospiraceae bacterium]